MDFLEPPKTTKIKIKIKIIEFIILITIFGLSVYYYRTDTFTQTKLGNYDKNAYKSEQIINVDKITSGYFNDLNSSYSWTAKWSSLLTIDNMNDDCMRLFDVSNLSTSREYFIAGDVSTIKEGYIRYENNLDEIREISVEQLFNVSLLNNYCAQYEETFFGLFMTISKFEPAFLRITCDLNQAPIEFDSTDSSQLNNMIIIQNYVDNQRVGRPSREYICSSFHKDDGFRFMNTYIINTDWVTTLTLSFSNFGILLAVLVYLNGLFFKEDQVLTNNENLELRVK